MFNPADWPIAWMARAERQHARNATTLLAPLGLHHREFRLMAILANSQGLTVGELAEQAVLERPTVSKMVDRLAAEGWVTRVDHPLDRRRSPLALTAKGQSRLEAAIPIVEELFSRYQRDVTPEAQKRFVREVQDFYLRVHAARPEESPACKAQAKAGDNTP
jgi:DNA-binding MarR family transcriptional regulator